MTDSLPAATSNIIQFDPRKLLLAPELAAVPMRADVAVHLASNSKTKELSEEIAGERKGVVQSMDDVGIIDPLKVTLSESGQTATVWDGRGRRDWALERGKETVPVMHVSEEVGRKLMEASVIGRNHWTKGQRAYLAVICHPEVADVKAGRPKKNTDSVGFTGAPELATHVGLKPDIVNQAVQVYRLFHAPDAKPGSAEAIEAADCKAKYEMSIWAGAGLGAVLAGIGGGQATKNKPRKASDWAALDKPLGTMTRLSREFDKWKEEERTKAMRLMTTRFKSDFSPGFRLALSEALAAADDSMA